MEADDPHNNIWCFFTLISRNISHLLRQENNRLNLSKNACTYMPYILCPPLIALICDKLSSSYTLSLYIIREQRGNAIHIKLNLLNNLLPLIRAAENRGTVTLYFALSILHTLHGNIISYGSSNKKTSSSALIRIHIKDACLFHYSALKHVSKTTCNRKVHWQHRL